LTCDRFAVPRGSSQSRVSRRPAPCRDAMQRNGSFIHFLPPRSAPQRNSALRSAPPRAELQLNATDYLMTTKPSFALSLDVAAVCDRLRPIEEGTIINYAQLSDLFGRTIDGGDPALQRALKRLASEGICFANIRGVGYRRHTDTTLIGEATSNRRRLRRLARRSGRRLAKVQNFETLTDQEKLQHQSHLALFGAVSVMASKKGITAIERVATTSNEKLPLGKTLEAFR
jgi:hypothetical protein